METKKFDMFFLKCPRCGRRPDSIRRDEPVTRINCPECNAIVKVQSVEEVVRIIPDKRIPEDDFRRTVVK